MLVLDHHESPLVPVSLEHHGLQVEFEVLNAEQLLLEICERLWAMQAS